MMTFISPRLAQAHGDRASRGGVRRRLAGARRPAVVGLDPGRDRRGRPRGLLVPNGRQGHRRGRAGQFPGGRAPATGQPAVTALACNLAAIAAFVGLVVAIAVKATWWWPFLVILAVTGFGFLLGLSSYGSGEPDDDDDADAGQPERSPVQS